MPYLWKVIYVNIQTVEMSAVQMSKRQFSRSFEPPVHRQHRFLVNKWYSEGTSVENLCKLLHRSEENVIQALKIGYEGYENEYSSRMEVEI